MRVGTRTCVASAAGDDTGADGGFICIGTQPCIPSEGCFGRFGDCDADPVKSMKSEAEPPLTFDPTVEIFAFSDSNVEMAVNVLMVVAGSTLPECGNTGNVLSVGDVHGMYWTPPAACP